MSSNSYNSYLENCKAEEEARKKSNEKQMFNTKRLNKEITKKSTAELEDKMNYFFLMMNLTTHSEILYGRQI